MLRGVTLGEGEPDLVLDVLDFGLAVLDVEGGVQVQEVCYEVSMLFQKRIHEAVDFVFGLTLIIFWAGIRTPVNIQFQKLPLSGPLESFQLDVRSWLQAEHFVHPILLEEFGHLLPFAFSHIPGQHITISISRLV